MIARIKNVPGSVTVCGYQLTVSGCKLAFIKTEDGRTYFIDQDMIEIIPDEVDPEEVNRLKHIEHQYERLLDTCNMLREHAKDKAALSCEEVDYSYYLGMMAGIKKVKDQIETIMKGDSDDERNKKG